MAIIIGDTSNETLTGGVDADLITGDSGDDSISGLGGDDTISGDAGADSLFGGDGNDSMFGGADDDLLQGGAGADTLDGGDGSDTLDYTTSNAGVLVNLQSGFAGGGHADGDNITGFENLTGSTLNDTLTGNIGANIIIGLGGDDSLDGGLGADALFGGLGNDTYFIDDAGDTVSEVSGDGVDHVHSSVTHVLGADFEHLTLTGGESINGTGNAGNNSITGNTGSSIASIGNNLLLGLEGNDTLRGNGGVDTLDGGTGDDAMYGGTGGDLFIVDSANDQVFESIDEGIDTVAASIDYTLTTPVSGGTNHIENITLTGSGNISATGNGLRNALVGNTGDNVLTGGGGNDTLRGEEGNDTLDGGTGDDQMTGGAGDDVYFVDSTQDSVVESSTNGGIDTVFSAIDDYDLELNFENLTLETGVLKGSGNNLDNVLTGNASDNTLVGESGNDTLLGDAGNDMLDGGSGADSMDGGAGDDVYKVDNLGDVAGEVGGGAGGIDRVEIRADHTMGAGIENLLVQNSAGDVDGIGNELNNTMTGGTQDNMLNGMDGDDTLSGLNGDDTLIGGAGIDVFVGGSGNDTYVIETSAESITETLNDGIDTVEIEGDYALSQHLENLILRGSGNFFADGNASANRLTGNTGNNELTGMAGNDTIVGGAGNDSLFGGEGADSMTGGLGDDLYSVDNVGDKIIELSGLGSGSDTVEASISYELGNNVEALVLTGGDDINGTGNSLANRIVGNSGANILSGEGGADTLVGGLGDDTLDGGSGNDSMSGGEGNDTYVTDSEDDLIEELASEGVDTIVSTYGFTLGANFENLRLTGTSGLTGIGNGADNVMIGNGGANLLSGLGGDDTLNGGAGADTLNGGTGDDRMTGGTGNDVFIIEQAGDVALETLVGGGIDRLQTVFSTVLGAAFENLTLVGEDDLDGTGNASANRMSGNVGDNSLSGLDGNDTISGGAGADTLNGGAGNDLMGGGIGDDVYFVDSTQDRIVEGSLGGTDLVFTTATFTMSTGLETLDILGSDDINATGNGKANTILGNGGANFLNGAGGADTLGGGNGNDTLDGGTGNDSLSGGEGDDVYRVNSKTDEIIEGSGNGIDLVLASSDFTLGANVENLTMQGSGTYRATGNGLDNEMTGNKASNRLSGLDGDDTLEGGLGNDVLTGGDGADHFVFATINAGNDTISDFSTADDRMVFEGLEVGSFVYRGASSFTGGSNNSEARFDATNAKLQIDVNGDGTADFSLTLTGVTQASDLSASDFLWS